MIGMKVNVKLDPKPLMQAAEKAAFKNLAHAGATIRKDAIDSIQVSKTLLGYYRKKTRGGKSRLRKLWKPSPVGKPPYSHVAGKMFFRRAIRFDTTKTNVVIGPVKSEAGTIMEKNEHDRRPFMGPAMSANLERFAGSFRGSIGG
jgi:hypothetical protein